MSTMPSDAELDDLIARVERLSGPDREVDARVAVVVLNWGMWKSKHGYWNITPPQGDTFNVAGRSPNDICDSRTGEKLPEEQPPFGWADDIECTGEVAEWTDSLDAVLALAERERPGDHWTVQSVIGGYRAVIGKTEAMRPKPALALLLALLRALKDGRGK